MAHAKSTQFRITDDETQFSMDFMADCLQGTSWRKGAPRDRIEKAIANSLTFGLFHGSRQIGLVRAVTDKALVTWICDLVIVPAYRKQGLGKWIMESIEKHPDIQGTRLVLSSVPELAGFYEKLGYAPMETGYSKIPAPE